ncbi:DinB family protein [Streptomyces justiciae]|uniref:DinB family protein n=1 Tax=Streptomyces justiciae TaxID=2780140 RepID=UPI00187E1A17|nr:DinB family protein [Streptomyces justiciae]MBE8471384.1 DinB family protein [Streptomyces justiciae]MCW8377168.1 DinB family protein [Streptomyces justiciae]
MTVSSTEVPRIDIPSATEDPAAYVTALLEVAAERDPFDVLAKTPVWAARLFADLPTELAETVPEEGEWPAAFTVGHLFDVDIVYGFRWRLVATEDAPVYPGYDEEKWAPLPRLPFRQMLDAWTGLRASNVALLAALPPEDWQRTGHHGEQGGETMEVMIKKVVGHDIAHINQIYRAIRLVRQAAGLDVAELDATYLSLGL